MARQLETPMLPPQTTTLKARMAKKIDRSRIDSGRVELPKKLAFLLSEKVDFISLTDRDGDWSVELSASVLAKLVKSKAELKAVKGEQKKLVTDHAAALNAQKQVLEEMEAELAKAERRLKALDKKLAAADGSGAPAKKAAKSRGTREGANLTEATGGTPDSQMPAAQDSGE